MISLRWRAGNSNGAHCAAKQKSMAHFEKHACLGGV
jgi:hypothetical protein